MSGIYLSTKDKRRSVAKETATGHKITVTFDDDSEQVFDGILKMKPEHVGKPAPVNENGTGVAAALVSDGDSIEAWYLFGEESMNDFLNYLHVTSDGNRIPLVSMYAPHGHINVTTLGGIGRG